MADQRRGDRRRPSADVLAAADTQRRRFAQQLHDETIQTLLSAIQDLEEAKQEIAEAPDAAASAVERSIELLVGSVRQLREQATDYDPNPPVGLGLADAIQLLADQAVHRAGLTVAVHVAVGSIRADERAVLTIVRELLANVAKHARASAAAVNVDASSEGGVRVVVNDDGVGFTPEQMREAFIEGHLGLPLITARVEEQGGTFSVDSRPGQGTTATVVLPPLRAQQSRSTRGFGTR